MDDRNPQTGRPYVRASKDKSGRERSPNEQLADLIRDATAHRWELIRPEYRDIGSASRYQSSNRKSFDQLIADLTADRFGAAILLLWEPRRGSRKVSEWVTLIELCEQRHVAIWVHTHNRLYDAAIPRDRRTLLEDAVDGEYDAATRSESITRALTANAAEGKPHGIASFGYTRRYEFEGSRRIIRQVEDPVEGPVARDIFRRVHAGEAFKSIADDLNRRGVPTRHGKRWHQATISHMARKPDYAGWRQADGERYEADWPPLVDRSVWLAIQARIGDPKRLTRRGDSGRHLLGGLILCDPCGTPLAVRSEKSGVGFRYVCSKGHVTISRDPVDQAVREVLLDYLSDEANYARLRRPDDSAELAAVRDQLRQARAEHMALADSGISVALAAMKEPAILERIERLRRLEDELQTPAQLSGLLGSGGDVRVRWRRAPLAAKREILRLLLVPALVGECRVRRTYARGMPVRERLFFRVD